MRVRLFHTDELQAELRAGEDTALRAVSAWEFFQSLVKTHGRTHETTQRARQHNNGRGKLLANELVILAVRSDPKPMHSTWHREAKCTVIETDSNAVKSTIGNRLEMQGWMIRIGLELREISVRYGLNFGGQCVETLPKPL